MQTIFRILTVITKLNFDHLINDSYLVEILISHQSFNIKMYKDSQKNCDNMEAL